MVELFLHELEIFILYSWEIIWAGKFCFFWVLFFGFWVFLHKHVWYAYVYECSCVYTCDGPMLISDVFLDCSPLYFCGRISRCLPAGIPSPQSAGITGDSHSWILEIQTLVLTLVFIHWAIPPTKGKPLVFRCLSNQELLYGWPETHK